MHMHFERSSFRVSLIMGIHVTTTFTHIAGTKQTLLNQAIYMNHIRWVDVPHTAYTLDESWVNTG